MSLNTVSCSMLWCLYYIHNCGNYSASIAVSYWKSFYLKFVDRSGRGICTCNDEVCWVRFCSLKPLKHKRSPRPW